LLPNHHTPPINAVFGPHQEPIGEFALGGRRRLVQHLIDAAKETLVIESFVSHTEGNRAGQLVPGVCTDALERQRGGRCC